MKNNVIIGAGEIGHTISKICNGLTFFHDPHLGVFATDEEGDNYHKDVVLHICFPCKDQFLFTEIVEFYINLFEPEAVFIHSTVSVGTTDKIIEQNDKDLIILYTPVRGRHETLPDHVRKFVKYFGPVDCPLLANNEEVMRLPEVELIHEIFPFIKFSIVDNARDIEMAKIMSTSYLGWNLLFEKEMYKMCKENDLDFKFVYSEFNKSYNDQCNDEVYPERFKRPIYDHVEGPIGGHCVIQNLELDDNFITKTMKDYFNGS